ncbi:MAG TPA: NAD(P)/FAD-dependent oxidoreductase [Trueperaceae bacterium]|nr:NAD(P)/FAD-dependent oxidoreductase [Trueperaceae bacterium]
MTRQRYDIVVIGAGTAGQVIAHKTAAAGKSVAIIDTRPYGGTCMLRGCDPKKVLVGAAEVTDWARRMGPHGVTGELAIDWPALMSFKRTFTDSVPGRVERSLEKSGVTTLHGGPRFKGPNELELDGGILTAEHIVLAVGARPRTLAFPGAEHLVTSTDFLDLDDLPKRIVFVGGGYVSFEFAHVAARAGATVTVLDRNERPLPGFEPELVDSLVRASRAVDIDVQLEQDVTKVERLGSAFRVSTSGGATITADLVVHGAGRVPELDGLGLEAAGIAFDAERGVSVDDHLRSTTNPSVYAAGDGADTAGWPLTPVASHEGYVVAANLLGKDATPDYRGTPSVVFTVPALARAGLLESEARARGLEVTVRHADTHDWCSARRTGQEHAGYKVIEERATGRILGAHLLGDRAGDVIDIFALAIRHGLTAQDLKRSILVHPSEASDVAYMV